MKYSQFSFVLLLFFLFSCGNHSDKMLAEAESIMNQYPDSALSLLQSIRDPHKFTGKQQADYCLLLTQALDKNNLPLNDSLLQIAVEYYSNQTDWDKKAKVFFYQGRLYYKSGMLEDAVRSFKHAEEWAAEAGNDNFSSSIFNHLGHINNKQYHYEKALSYFKKALSLSQKLGNTEWTVYNLLEISSSFLFLEQRDSANFYSDQLIASLESSSDKSKSYAYHYLGILFDKYDELEKATDYLRLSLQYDDATLTPYAHTVLADIYMKKNDLQQADYHWQQAFATDNFSTQAFIYKSMFSRMLKEEKYKEASLYADSVITAIEDVYADLLDGELLKIQEQYDNDSLRTKVLEYKLRSYRLLLLFITVLVFGACAFSLYQRHRNSKEALISERIARKEAELAEYQQRMVLLEEKMSLSAEEKECSLLEHEELKEKIKVINEELDGYKELAENNESDKTMHLCSIGRGLEIYCSLQHSNDILLHRSDFQDIINYHRVIDLKFSDLLCDKAYSLSERDKVICILIRLNIPHKQIASSLSMKSASLTRSKTRIKKEKLKLDDSFSLENYIKNI